jgi:CO/xanthine dehydrogenase FAD-binding subunit
MKPPPFEYEAPTTIQEVVALLQQHDGEAKILAGGQSLMPLLNMRFARPTALIDLRRLTELDYIREENGTLAIGAMTTKRSVERSDLVKSRQPLLHASTTWIAHPQIRNRGTVGGSMAQADPAAEYPAVALALDAEFVIVGPDGQRSVAASDFFVTYLTTAL